MFSPKARALWVLVVLFLGLRVVFFGVGSPPVASDVKFYFPYAVRAVDAGQVPSRDFEVEYPPGSWPVMFWPRLLGPEPGKLWPLLAQLRPGQPVPPELLRAYEHYRVWFRRQMFLLDLVGLVLMAWALRRWAPEKAPLALAVYAAGGLTLVPILYDRLDLGVWLLVLAGVVCWFMAWHRQQLRWLAASATWWGLGISYKLVPGVGVPALAIALWRLQPRWKIRLGILALGAGAALAPFALWWPWTGWKAFGFLSYHAQRGTQYESLWGNLQAVLALGGLLPAQTQHVAKAVDVSSAWAQGLVMLSYLATLAALLASVWPVAKAPKQLVAKLAAGAACVSLLWLVSLGKVLSPQFLIWAGPAAVMATVLILPPDQQTRWLMMVFLAWALTGAIFPWGYLYWGLHSWRLILLVALRNALLVALSLRLTWALWQVALKSSPGEVAPKRSLPTHEAA